MSQELHIVVGARPGTLIIPEGSPPPKISLILYADDSIEEREIDDPNELAGIPESGRAAWIDVQGLGDEDVLRTLAEIFSIHPLALEDIVHPGPPKTEFYDDSLLLIAHGTRLLEEDLDFEQVGVVLGSHWLLTFRANPSSLLEPVLGRLRRGRGRIRREGCDYLAYALLDGLVDTHFPVTEALLDDLDDLEGAILENAEPKHLEEVNRLRRRLLKLRRTFKPQRDAVHLLLRGEDDLISDSVRVYLRDVQDHCRQLNESIDAAREMVANLVTLYLSVLGHRTNDVMRLLTIVTSIFVPLTFLAGIYGMNFQQMPELGWQWGYPGLLLIMAGVVVSLLIFFRRKGWLGTRSTESDRL